MYSNTSNVGGGERYQARLAERRASTNHCGKVLAPQIISEDRVHSEPAMSKYTHNTAKHVSYGRAHRLATSQRPIKLQPKYQVESTPELTPTPARSAVRELRLSSSLVARSLLLCRPWGSVLISFFPTRMARAAAHHAMPLARRPTLRGFGNRTGSIEGQPCCATVQARAHRRW